MDALFNFIGEIFGYVLMFFNNIFGNFGVAIIAFTTGITILAFSLMSNHVHFVVHATSEEAEAFRAMGPDTEGLLSALSAGDLGELVRCMGNTLERVTAPMHPEIPAIEEAMVSLGAARAMMSGSGPTVFGIFDDEDRAQAALRALRARAEEFQVRQVYLTEPYQPGSRRKG